MSQQTRTAVGFEHRETVAFRPETERFVPPVPRTVPSQPAEQTVEVVQTPVTNEIAVPGTLKTPVTNEIAVPVVMKTPVANEIAVPVATEITAPGTMKTPESHQPSRDEASARTASMNVQARGVVRLLLERGRGMTFAQIRLAAERGQNVLLPSTPSRLRTVLEKLSDAGLVTAGPVPGRRRPVWYSPSPSLYWYRVKP